MNLEILKVIVLSYFVKVCFVFNYMNVWCVSVCGYAQVSASACGDQKEAADPWKLQV